MNSQQYIEVTVRLSPFTEEGADILTAALADLPYEAFVTEAPYLKAYIPQEKYSARDLRVVLSGADDVAGFEAAPVRGENWNRDWESHFTPIVVDDTVTVKGPFNGEVPRTRFNIWIDPGMAFGTGAHETTFMMIQAMLLREERIRGRVVLDMGCGTAVLGILAAKMRARKVYAIDIDEVAARSAWGNARWNRVGTRIQTLCGDASLLQMASYDCILANIHRNIILQDLPTYVRSLRHGGDLLLSGFFEDDAPAVTAAAEALGLVPDGTLVRAGWACVALRKP